MHVKFIVGLATLVRNMILLPPPTPGIASISNENQKYPCTIHSLGNAAAVLYKAQHRSGEKYHCTSCMHNMDSLLYPTTIFTRFKNFNAPFCRDIGLCFNPITAASCIFSG